MSDDNITREEVSAWLEANEKKAVWLAQTMRVTPATVSRWLSGKNPISGSDAAVLKLLIRGEIPFDIVHEKLLHGVLDFTEDQWKVIAILAIRDGKSPSRWIADKIRWISAGDPEARAELARIETDKCSASTSRFQVIESDAKVAEGTGTQGK